VAENIQQQANFRQQRHDARTSQTYVAFLEALCKRGNLDRDQAERAAGSVLCALEMRIQADEAKDLNSQLPVKVRELLVRCERHEGEPGRTFNRDEFLDIVCGDLSVSKEEAEQITRAVFSTIRKQVSEGEAEKVAINLPPDLRALWAREV
jgi:uncharacterized protein (DUF2267 family)